MLSAKIYQTDSPQEQDPQAYLCLGSPLTVKGMLCIGWGLIVRPLLHVNHISGDSITNIFVSRSEHFFGLSLGQFG